MSTSITIRRYLEKQDIRFKALTYGSNAAQLYRNGTESVTPEQIAKAVILKDYQGMLMAVIAGPQQLKIDTINNHFKRQLTPAKQEDYTALFSDCESNLIPPLGEAYGLPCIVDASLLNSEKVFFVSGNRQELLGISASDFKWLHNNAWYGNNFHHISCEKLNPHNKPDQLLTSPLPEIPLMAKKILQLQKNPFANSEDLARLIEKDPELANQIVQYAQTGFYGVCDPIDSIRQAISRVLGYELAINMALGIALSRSFRGHKTQTPSEQAYWRQATYSATIAQGLAYCAAPAKNLMPGKAYLAGLVHNIGSLLLERTAPKKYAQLKQNMSLYPDASVLEHEADLINTNHTCLGRRLSQSWRLPEETIVCTAEHHNSYYRGKHHNYANLIYVCDSLLKRHGMGDGHSTEVPANLLQCLGISYSQALDVLEKTMAGSSELDTIARRFAA